MILVQESGDEGAVARLANQRLRKLICGWKSWLWLATTKKIDYLSIFPSNNRLTGYGYGLSKAYIRLRPMSYGTNTVKGFCIRLTNIENTGSGSLGSLDGWGAKTRWSVFFASSVLQLWCRHLCKRTVRGTWKVFVYPSAPLQAEVPARIPSPTYWNYCI